MTFRGNASLRRALYTFCSPAMQHSFGLQPALCCIAYTRRTNIRKPPVPANIRPSAATGNGLSGTVTAPFQRRGRKRYNTLDFAAQNRVPTGCCSPLLETLSQRDCIPLDTCIFLHTAVPKLKKRSLPSVRRKNKRKPASLGSSLSLDAETTEKCSMFIPHSFISIWQYVIT